MQWLLDGNHKGVDIWGTKSLVLLFVVRERMGSDFGGGIIVEWELSASFGPLGLLKS